MRVGSASFALRRQPVHLVPQALQAVQPAEGEAEGRLPFPLLPVRFLRRRRAPGGLRSASRRDLRSRRLPRGGAPPAVGDLVLLGRRRPGRRRPRGRRALRPGRQTASPAPRPRGGRGGPGGSGRAGRRRRLAASPLAKWRFGKCVRELEERENRASRGIGACHRVDYHTGFIASLESARHESFDAKGEEVV